MQDRGNKIPLIIKHDRLGYEMGMVEFAELRINEETEITPSKINTKYPGIPWSDGGATDSFEITTSENITLPTESLA